MKSLIGALALTLYADLGFAGQSNLTMLLPAGNRDVAQRFADFEQIHQGCQAKGGGPRVLLTGFGLFEGVPYNISGAVIENLSSTQFWPDSLDASSGVMPAVLPPFQTGILSQGDHGARICIDQSLAWAQVVLALVEGSLPPRRAKKP